MFHLIKTYITLYINVYVDWKVVIRTYSNHQQQDRKGGQEQIENSAYILYQLSYPLMLMIEIQVFVLTGLTMYSEFWLSPSVVAWRPDERLVTTQSKKANHMSERWRLAGLADWKQHRSLTREWCVMCRQKWVGARRMSLSLGDER